MNMRITILPKTVLGWWSFGVAILSLVFLIFPIHWVLGLIGVAHQIGLSPGQIKGISFAIAGGAALVTGLISIIRRKERSILVFLAVGLGAFCLLFVLGEILFPH
jgi:hypothetical protein